MPKDLPLYSIVSTDWVRSCSSRQSRLRAAGLRFDQLVFTCTLSGCAGIEDVVCAAAVLSEGVVEDADEKEEEDI
jgi:hypothetical protein